MVGAGNGRTVGNALILPDASILVIGGSDPISGPELSTNQYSDAYGNFQQLARSPTVRNYHATGVVTASGRVFVGGGEGRFSAPGGHDYDIFEPPYMQGAPRPSAPELTPPTLAIDQWGQSTYLFDAGQAGLELVAEVEGMASLDKVVLLAPGSMTHHSDMSARYIELRSVAVNQKTLQFDLPTQTVVPRGYYMLWAVTNGGIPSEAVWIKVQ